MDMNLLFKWMARLKREQTDVSSQQQQQQHKSSWYLFYSMNLNVLSVVYDLSFISIVCVAFPVGDKCLVQIENCV